MSFGNDLERERAQILRAVRQAGNNWAQAMRAHKMAPPDAGFAGRLRALLFMRVAFSEDGTMHWRMAGTCLSNGLRQEEREP